MEFCPFCSNCLLLFNGASEVDAFFRCKTCPYTYPVKEDIVKTKKFKGKIPVEVQKIVDLRPIVKESCPKCAHKYAKITERQMRSADEPKSRFYECVECGNTWRDDS